MMFLPRGVFQAIAAVAMPIGRLPMVSIPPVELTVGGVSIGDVSPPAPMATPSLQLQHELQHRDLLPLDEEFSAHLLILLA